MDKSDTKFSDIIVFGGNRQNEDGPLILFCKTAKSLGFSLYVYTDLLHYSLPTTNGTFRDLLDKYNIPFEVTEFLNRNHIKQFVGPKTLGISINSIWIFKDDIISLFNGRLINYHNAKLPEERGAAAYSWKIMRGENRGQLTFHKIAKKIDTGATCFKMAIRFPNHVKCPLDFYNFMEEKEKIFFMKFLQKYKEKPSLEFEPINLAKSFYWPPLHTLTHGWIDWSWSQKQICDFINAFSYPFQGASTHFKGERVFLRCASPYPTDLHFHPFQSGIVIRNTKREIFVIATNGVVKVKDLVNTRGDSIITKISEGGRFYTPIKKIESARCSKALRKPDGFRIKNYEKE